MILLVQENQVYCDSSGKPFQPELPSLIFIHGAQNDHSVWGYQSRSLANRGSHCGYNVLAIDLPGHGQSKGNALTTIEAMAQWLLALLDAMGIKKAGLIGHSMGSLIALETAHCAPERVTQLALLGTAYPMKVSEVLLSTARDNEAAAFDMVTKWSHHQTGTVQDNTKRLMQRMSEINPKQLLHTDLSACHHYAQGEAAALVVNQHHCPTLFMLAQQDRMTPVKASVKLREIIAEAKVVEIAECGHAMMAEQPDAVVAGLVDFFSPLPLAREGRG
jgi:pimeloyl-ACP methyl ester carboxylesterase